MALSMTAADASVVDIVFTETGTGVSVIGSGSVDTSLMTLNGSSAHIHGMNPQGGAIGAGSSGSANLFSADPFTPFGTASSIGAAPGTGDIFGLYFLGGSPVLAVSDTYVSSAALSFTLDLPGESFGTLGVGPNVTYTTTGATVNFIFDSAEVPLPASLPLLALSALALGLLRARRRS